MTQIELEYLTVKRILYTITPTPVAQILVCSALRLAVSEIKGRKKLEMH